MANRGRGRPAQPNKVALNTYIDKDLINRLRFYALTQGSLYINQFLDKAIQDFLEKNEGQAIKEYLEKTKESKVI